MANYNSNSQITISFVCRIWSFKTGFMRFRFIFMYISVLLAHCMTIARGSQKKVLKPLELEL